MKPTPHKIPRPKSEAQMSAIGRKGAAASNKKSWLYDPNRPQPSMPVFKCMSKPDPFEDKP
jgi:hypothetical protein